MFSYNFQVLEVVPVTWPVEVLSGFLTKALRQLVREKNEAMIGRALSRSLSTKVCLTLSGGYLSIIFAYTPDN